MATQDSRIRIKRSTVTTQVPTVAPSLDHTDGTWSANDIYVGELYANVADDRLFLRTNNGIREVRLYTPTANAMTVYHAKLTLTSAQVLTLHSVPVTFGITVPTGYFGRPISVDFHMLYNSTPYATNTSIGVRAVGASDELMKGTNYLSATSDTFCPLAVQGGAPNAEMLIASQDFEVFAKTGDPTAGDSDITLYLTYLLIEA